MTPSNAERQRRHRQRTKEKLARGRDPFPWEEPDPDFTTMTDDKVLEEMNRRAMVLEPIQKWMKAPGDELMRRDNQRHQEHAAWRKQDNADLAQRVAQAMTKIKMKAPKLAKTLNIETATLDCLLDTKAFPNGFSWAQENPIREKLNEWLEPRPKPRRRVT